MAVNSGGREPARTRCAADYTNGVRRKQLASLIALSVLLVPLPTRVVAQGTTEENPRVERLSFRGVQNISQSDLRASIVTEERRCKSALLAPICLVLSSATFQHRPRLDRQELARDELRVRVLYFKRGYREAQVTTRIEDEGEGVAVTFDVVEGEATIMQTLEVRQTRELLRPSEMRRAGLPQPPGPLNLELLDSAAVRLRGMLWDRGYADAEVRDTAFVDDAANTARVEVLIEPRALAIVDTVHIIGNEEVSTHTIVRMLDLRSGQPFRRSDVHSAQRRLYRSELFRQALMDVPQTEDSLKTVLITVREAPMRGMRVGGGFSTVDFVQTEARYTLYNWMGAARKLELRGVVGNLFAPQLYGRSIFGSSVPQGIATDVDDVFLRPTWQISAELTQPSLLSRRNSLGLSVFAHRRSVPGIVVDEGAGASATVTRRLSDQFPASLTYRFERTKVDAGDLYFCVNFGVCTNTTIETLRGSQSLSPLWLSAYADLADDPLEPTRGWTARLEAEHASALTFSDFRYNRASARGARYLRVGPGVLAARVRLGWISGSASTAEAVGVPDAENELLHPRKRFYAGGSRSVRGFGENQLGPRILTIDPANLLSPSDTAVAGCTAESIASGACDPNIAPSDEFQPRPLGGTSVVEGTLEYRLPLAETISAAVFLDAGRVSDGFQRATSGARSALTPGFGFRYRSPIGPIRIDLGVRPRLSEELPVVTQISDEEGNLHLVQLSTLKRYDPLESSGGFLSGFFSRLQLHLSIGEAF